MSLHYILNKDDSIDDSIDIEHIINSINKSILESKGLRLCTYIPIVDPEKIFGDLKVQDLQILHEEVLWKNLTYLEKSEKFLEYLNKIYIDGNELIITDPYIFGSTQSDYKDLLKTILEKCKFKTISIITNKTEPQFEKELCNQISKKINIYFSTEFHDRFWISGNQKGFIVGSSLNGIGNKYCIIQEIDKNDAETIFHLAHKIIEESEI